jgi:hypothetical protein
MESDGPELATTDLISLGIDDKGVLDEIIGHEVYFHLERLSDNQWWMVIQKGDQKVTVNLLGSIHIEPEIDKEDQITLTEDQVFERLVPLRLVKVTQRADGTPIRYGTDVMVGDKGDGSFILYPRHDDPRQRMAIRLVLMAAFADASNVEIKKGSAPMRV